MTRMTAAAVALFVAVLLAPTVGVKAQQFNALEKTFVTFSGPVELPGMTLAKGTYMFKLADTPGRNVVQVFNQDGSKIYGQFLFVQAKRLEATPETVVTFKETAANTTPAVQYWYFPNESIGKEFVYPKAQALQIAARTHSRVLATDGTTAGDVSAVDESGRSSPVEPQAAAQPQPAPAARPQPAPASQQARAETSPREFPAPSQRSADSDRQFGNELPRTASPVPFVTLMGFLSLAGALALRLRRV